MRRLYSLLAFLGFVGTIAGCHTAGACDCAGPGNPCCYGKYGIGAHAMDNHRHERGGRTGPGHAQSGYQGNGRGQTYDRS